jgi:lipopolysaccharide export system protein LptA
MWSTDDETRGIFSGNVVVSGTNMKLTCDRLEITAASIGDKSMTIGTLEKFKHLLASGRVHIIQGDREARCGQAEVFPREDRVILKDNPMIIDHRSDWTCVGRELVMLRGERRIQGEAVKFVGPAIKDLGVDKNAPDNNEKSDSK